MLWIALQVARGEPPLPTHHCDVLYLCLEDTYTRIQSRLQLLTEEAPNTLRFSVLCHRLGEGFQEQLEDFLKDYPQTRLVIIDTLQKVRDNTVSQGSMYANDYGDMAALKTIADRHHLAIILVHHLRKLTDRADPFNEVSGSTALMGAADTTYLLKKSKRAEETSMGIRITTPMTTDALKKEGGKFEWESHDGYNFQSHVSSLVTFHPKRPEQGPHTL